MPHCSFACPKHSHSHLYSIVLTQLPALLHAWHGTCPWKLPAAPALALRTLIHSTQLLAYLPETHASCYGLMRLSLKDFCVPRVTTATRAIGIAITKQCVHVMSCFMATFLDNGNSGPSCCHNLSATCNMGFSPSICTNMFFAFVSRIKMSALIIITKVYNRPGLFIMCSSTVTSSVHRA